MKTLRIQGRRVWDTVEATEFARDSKCSADQPVLEGDTQSGGCQPVADVK